MGLITFLVLDILPVFESFQTYLGLEEDLILIWFLEFQFFIKKKKEVDLIPGDLQLPRVEKRCCFREGLCESMEIKSICITFLDFW